MKSLDRQTGRQTDIDIYIYRYGYEYGYMDISLKSRILLWNSHMVF